MKKHPINLFLLPVLLLALLLPIFPAQAQSIPDFVTLIDQDMVMAHVEALSVDIGARPMGTEAELAAADYIAGQFEAWGYAVEVEEFETIPPDSEDETVTSRNVIATKAGGDQILVVGAHMDSVTDGTGAGDNATGVAVILAAAEALADQDLAYTVIFVAFGAEESGDPMGSEYFVENWLVDDIDSVVAMINIDSVGVGTNLNAYAGAEITWPDDDEAAPEIEGGPVWVRDLALDLAAEMNLPFGTSPDDTWGGFTGDWSDHYAFVEAGIPIVYFEAWQWEDSENPWWGQETAEGDVMHTPGDIFDNVVPEKVEMTAELVAATAYTIASGLVAEASAIPVVSEPVVTEPTPLPAQFPTPYQTQLAAAEQVFEHGRMFWIRFNRQVWVMVASADDPYNGDWYCYNDTFEEGDVESDPSLVPPADMSQPIRGFGKVWREQPGLQDLLGWAITPEFELNSTYAYLAGGYVDQNGQYVSGPGEHRLTTLYNETISFFEGGANGDCSPSGTWRMTPAP